MEKKTISKTPKLGQFAGNQIKSLSSITGGSSTNPDETICIGYDTFSSATDSDKGDHDSDL